MMLSGVLFSIMMLCDELFFTVVLSAALLSFLLWLILFLCVLLWPSSVSFSPVELIHQFRLWLRRTGAERR